MKQKLLLVCGIFSSLLYICMNIFIPQLFKGYSVSSQTVSELSAIDAPTRSLWVTLAVVYILLFAAFGAGVLKAGRNNRFLLTTGKIIIIYVIINLYWPPMHLRGNTLTITDTLHIVWAMITITLMILIMGFGAAALGKGFRLYTVITFIVFVAFGVLIGAEAPGIAKNLPTPNIGTWERINIACFMIWVIAFSTGLLKRK